MKTYLTAKQIRKAPLGFEYKKNSVGGSIVFKKKALSVRGKRVVAETHCKNNVWALDENELKKIAKLAGIHFLSSYFSKNNGTVKCKVFAKTKERKLIYATGKASRKTVKPKKYWKKFRQIAEHRARFDLLQRFINFNELKADTHYFPIKIPRNKKHLNWEKYTKLYKNYGNPEELHYFEQGSPENIRLKNILAEIHFGWTVMDVGCNSGFIGKRIMKKDCIVYGIDINEGLLKKAKSKGLIVQKAFAEEIPFENCFFDCVILGYMLEHVLRPEKVLKEAWRVLKSRGKLIGSVPTEYGDWGEHNYKIHPEHLRYYSEKTLRKSLQKKGFKMIKIRKELYCGRDIADSYFFTAKKPGGESA